MTTRFKLVEQALRTTNGTADFTNSGLGSENGKGAIVLASYATALDTITAHLEVSAGFIAGTTDNVMSTTASDAVTGNVSAVDGAVRCNQISRAFDDFRFN